MKPARKLRVVDCPQREGDPIKALVTGDGKHLVFGHDGYGCKPIERLPHNPPAHEANIIARAMSIRWHYNRDVPTFDEAERIIAAANRPKRGVTVPEPLTKQENAE